MSRTARDKKGSTVNQGTLLGEARQHGGAIRMAQKGKMCEGFTGRGRRSARSKLKAAAGRAWAAMEEKQQGKHQNEEDSPQGTEERRRE